MAKLISVIVPIYNTEKYLYRCVQSVLCQTYSCFELLLIDDGSQDNSAAVCETLCAMDGRVRFFPRNHEGVSAARNLGLGEAKGDYIFFLDSDDTIHPRLLKALVELCEATGAALGMEDYWHVDGGESYDFPDSMSVREDKRWEYTYMTNESALQQFSSGENGEKFWSIGGKMVRRGAMESLRFDEKLHNAEDTLFVYQLLEMGSDAVILWEEWYAYWKYPERGSSHRLTVQSWKDIYRCWKYIWEQERERPAGAKFCAKSISRRLRRLYVRSRRDNNKEVSVCLRRLARDEARNEQFQLLDWGERCKHYTAFWCYPIYLLMHRFCTWRWQCKQKGNGEK